MPLILRLWLHREERDAWLVSRFGVGAGVFLPKSEIEIEPGHPVPVLQPVGPVSIEVPEWLALDRGLIEPAAHPDQGALF